jgi:hypothetical protein
MRLALCLKEKGIKPTDTYLDISGLEFQSISGIQNVLPRLTHLHAGNNELRSLEVQ